MHVSKLDAARRQLDSAVRLFFLNGDPVAVHTLTSAARGLLRDLAAAERKHGVLDETFEAYVRPEKKGEVHALINSAQNFFKHADKDPDEIFDFNPETTEFLLWDTCALYTSLTTHRLPLPSVFNVWFLLSNPDVLMPEAQQQVPKLSGHLNLSNRRAFFLEMLPVAEEWCAGAEPGQAKR